MTEKDLEIQELRRELQAYKDTGLKPEDVIELMGSLGNAISIMADYHLIGDTGSIGDIDHIHGLLKAEKDGRLVVLPCYTGDKVYMPCPGKILELEVGSIFLNGSVTKIYYYSSSICSVPKDFGKTVFLTHEEAEAALKGEQNGKYH